MAIPFETISSVSGNVGIRQAPTPVDLTAYVSGTVADVLPDEGVVVETRGALIQGIFVGVGFAIVGLPSPIVFGVLATIAAFLPAGAAAVLIPAVIYLAFAGRWGAATFMAIWTAAMWVIENVLRPVLTAQQAEVSTLAIFIGAIGGAATFGILGLVIGPVLLSFTVALLRFAEENTPKTP